MCNIGEVFTKTKFLFIAFKYFYRTKLRVESYMGRKIEIPIT